MTPAERQSVSREELKEMLVVNPETGERDYLRLQTRCVRAFGSAAGIFLRDRIFFDGKSALSDGWTWNTEAETEAGTGLSRSEQRKARKILVALGVLEEDRRGVPRRMHYRVDLLKLAELLHTSRSTLNQWKRHKEPGPEQDRTLDPNYREDGNTDLACEDGITDLASEDGITDLASEDGTTDLAIQREPEGSTEVPSEGSPAGGTAAAPRRSAPLQSPDKSIKARRRLPEDSPELRELVEAVKMVGPDRSLPELLDKICPALQLRREGVEHYVAQARELVRGAA